MNWVNPDGCKPPPSHPLLPTRRSLTDRRLLLHAAIAPQYIAKSGTNLYVTGDLSALQSQLGASASITLVVRPRANRVCVVQSAGAEAGGVRLQDIYLEASA